MGQCRRTSTHQSGLPCVSSTRLALRVLLARGADRAGLVEFWEAVTKLSFSNSSEPMANYQRATEATMHLNGISRRVGVDRRPMGICEAMRAEWTDAGLVPTRATGGQLADGDWLLLPVVSIAELAASLLPHMPD